MTDLVDRYLAAVGRALPDGPRADILAELRDELLTAIEVREDDLGRRLDRTELEALLKTFGHPLIVAGRYRKVQQLIGPEVFPIWWAVLKVVVGVLGGLYLVVVVLRLVFDPGPPVLGPVIPDIVEALLIAFGAVTLAAVAAERFGWARHLYRWSPRELPVPTAKPRSPFEIAAEIGIEIVFLMWWTGQIQFRQVIPWRAVEVELSDAWAPFFWPVIAYSLAELVINVLALSRPGWARTHAALAVARGLIGSAILGLLLTLESWTRVSSSTLPAAQVAEAQVQIDTMVQVALAVALAVVVVRTFRDLRTFWRAIRDDDPRAVWTA